jgi:hypothetical protein
MNRTLLYVAMTRDERNAADAVPAQAGINVYQQTDREKARFILKYAVLFYCIALSQKP